MKKKRMKLLLALLVTAAMIINEPLASTYATESIETQTDDSVRTGSSEETSQSEDIGGDAEEETLETNTPDETTETSEETEDSGEKTPDETEDPGEKTPDETEDPGEKTPDETEDPGEKTPDETEDPGENPTETGDEEEPEETDSAEDTEETSEESTEELSEETTEDETTETEDNTEELTADEKSAGELSAEALGFKTMELSSEMLKEKNELSEVLISMKSMTPDEDYAKNELVYYADTQETAEQIAECYAGTIIDYEYGIAVIEINQNVYDAITLAADAKVGLPAVYPNIYYEICDEWQIIEAEEIENRAEENVDISTAGEFDFPYEDEHLYATAPNDAYFDSQWYHDNINTIEAWNVTKGENITVAVIDTGIDYTHPDLQENIVGYTSTVGGTGRDDNGHGTHCAGIIAAVDNNGIGIAGVAPDAGIYSVKVMASDGRGSTGNITQGVIAAKSRGVDVISMSLGGICWDQMFQKAIDDAVSKGIVVIAAAGNESTSQKSYPAAYNNVISVAATDTDNELTYFSNYGSWVDIAAPGDNIYSTLPTDMTNGYGYDSGTSMACPVVAGTVALILGASQQLRNTDSKAGVNKIRNVLMQCAVKNGAISFYEDKWYPLIDVEASVFSLVAGNVDMPQITFSSPSTDGKTVTAGENQYFELKTETQHSKIYYTINGKKPTAQTGRLYMGKIYMPQSGKVKIQAVAVVGNKSSKVFSRTYTFDVKAESLVPICQDNMSVAIGKSIQLGVEVVPAYASRKDFEWSSSDTSGMIKVDKKGKVTCSKKATEGMEAVITAKTKDGTEISYPFTVRATGVKSTEVTLNATSLKMSKYANWDNLSMKEKGYVSQFRLVPSGETTQYLYKSSNKKVAVVDAQGNVSPCGKGTAKITVTANDGSGKKAVCNVTVVNPVFDIDGVTSTGFDNSYDAIPIAIGCTIPIKSKTNYGMSNASYKASNSKLQWTSNSDKVTVTNGKVKCKSNAIPGTRVTITVSAKDGFGAYETFTFEVKDRITKIYMKSGLKNVTSKSYKLPTGYSIYEPDLYIMTKNNTNNCYSYMSVTVSNKDVACRMYNNGRMCIVGTKPGTSKITYTARDGSNKKFTINLKVTK